MKSDSRVGAAVIVGVVFGVVGLCVARPSNILVTKQGIKLLDFGLAKQNAPRNATGSTITEEGQIVGTLRRRSGLRKSR